MNNTRLGLTLVELLVGLALMGLVLAALSAFFLQSSRASVQSAARADLQQEALNAQQLITGRLKAAFYVFPKDTVFNLGTGNLRKNPTSSPVSGSWRVGGAVGTASTQPILAMILPPTQPTVTCPTSPGSVTTNPSNEEETGGFTPPNATVPTGTDGCYRFHAFYAVKRSQWAGNTSGSNDPGDDSNNADTWVLVEYQDYYYTSTLPATIPTTMPVITPSNRSKAYLLMDYLAPSMLNNAAAAAPKTTRPYKMFELSPETGDVQKVTINLASARQVNGALMRLPGNSAEYSISVTPGNLGKVATP